VLAFRDEYCAGPQPGDHLAKSLSSAQVVVVTQKLKSLTQAEVDKSVPDNLKNATPWDHVGGRATEITVAGAFPFSVGDSVYCPDRQGNGFIFWNNRVHSPGRILIKAGDGLIENNEVTDCHSGVTVCPEVPGTAAAGIANLVIRGNRFSGTGYFCPLWNSCQAGSIAITADGVGNQLRPPGVFRNITIEDNRFEDIKGPAIVASSAQGLTIQNNIFCRLMTVTPFDVGGMFGINPKALIWLDQCEQVKVAGNRVYRPGDFLQALVAGPNLDEALGPNPAPGVEIRIGETCPEP
jgi:hypothetical protein